MIGVLLQVLILVLLLGIIWYGAMLLSPDPRLTQIIQLVLLVIFVIALVYLLLPLAGRSPPL
jgi:hypothetical protein